MQEVLKSAILQVLTCALSASHVGGPLAMIGPQVDAIFDEPVFRERPTDHCSRSTSFIISIHNPLPLSLLRCIPRGSTLSILSHFYDSICLCIPRDHYGSWKVGYVILLFCAPELMTALYLDEPPR